MNKLPRNFRLRQIPQVIKVNRPDFYAPLTHNLLLDKGQEVATFTRATIATVTDFEGLIKTVKSGEVRFEGARRVENLIATKLNSWIKAATGTGVIATSVAASVAGELEQAYQITLNRGAGNTGSDMSQLYITIPNGVVGNRYVFSFRIKGTVGEQVAFRGAGGVAYVVHTFTGNWDRLSTSEVAAGAMQVSFASRGGQNTTNNVTFYAKMPMVENVTGQANQNPSEYVSNGVLAAPYHNAGADGVKYFNYQNGNTVVSNVVTEAQGLAIAESSLKGVLIEVASSNLNTYSSDLTNAAYSKTNTTAAINALAPDGTTTGNTLTATATAVTVVIKTVVATATTHTFSFFTKKGSRTTAAFLIRNSTTAIYFTTNTFNYDTGVNSGVGWKAEVYPNGWYRLSYTNSGSEIINVGNTMFMYLGATGNSWTANDTILLWGVQCEAKPMATSYIPTTTASVARNADVLTFPNAGNVNDTAGTVLMDVTPAFDIPNSATAGYGNQLLIDFGSSKGQIFVNNQLLGHWDSTQWIFSPTWIPLKNTTYKIGSKYGSAGQRNFLNGTAGTIGAFDGSINSSTNMTIGGYGGGTTYNFGGSIKNLRIYKKALSDNTISNLTTT